MVDMADVVFGNHDNSTVFGATVQYVCREGGVQLNSKRSSCLVSFSGYCAVTAHPLIIDYWLNLVPRALRVVVVGKCFY